MVFSQRKAENSNLTDFTQPTGFEPGTANLSVLPSIDTEESIGVGPNAFRHILFSKQMNNHLFFTFHLVGTPWIEQGASSLSDLRAKPITPCAEYCQLSLGQHFSHHFVKGFPHQQNVIHPRCNIQCGPS